ncbi:metal-dependent hydrolase [Leptospira perolatii]|uniref:Metal-dependent hydrolase n=1 Tax=Leptospira perolatii TaxID=2023191 RepID=A0A2M9ZP07_9LEPT|nr:endonuclease/exonuclease/phosphatase family protein [Leptospira perolatii]PJZ69666.1 metal-dependent hydrolase [Leptospira perolatii]PJZ73653.1 metal-dependent hydrolase [Leptospira perolatii]
MKILKAILVSLLVFFAVLFVTIYLITFHPSEREEMKIVCTQGAPSLDKAKELKVLSWNVQYFAGKNRVFWYDVPDESGPDTAPSKEDVQDTLRKVALVLTKENPDIILLQEVDDGSKRTFGEDQTERLLPLLHDAYPCRTEAFYWKAGFVPHPKVMGSAGMKLVTLSKYKITTAVRTQLPIPPADMLSRQFQLKRAILEAEISTANGTKFTILNTHLDAFSMGTDTMQKQVDTISKILTTLDERKEEWILAGDFNLLPPKFPRNSMHPHGAFFYSDQEEMKPLFNKWKPGASVEELNGKEQSKYYTYFANDPAIGKADRTIDYLFYSNQISKSSYKVLQDGVAGHTSDHFPIVGTFKLSD